MTVTLCGSLDNRRQVLIARLSLLQDTALAPFAEALETNPPLAAELATSPLFAEALTDPETAASQIFTNAILNAPSTLEAIEEEDS